MTDYTDRDDGDLAKMIDDVIALAQSWRFRGFDPVDIVAALAASGITAMQGAGMQREDMVAAIDRHLGRAEHTRPTVKA